MLKDYLDSYFQDTQQKNIFIDILGTSDGQDVQLRIEYALEYFLQLSIQKILFVESSIGVVFGFLCSSGDRIVLKVYSPKLQQSYLENINRVINVLYQEKFPVPKALSPIFTFGHTHAGFYKLIEGNKEDAHKPNIRSVLARYLARFSEIVDQYQLQPLENFFQLAAHKRLWPIPHNVLFDLHKTTRGAGWIAKKAIAARKILHSFHAEKKLAHTDWGVKNAIFINKQLVGIFDWDSLGAMTELEMVGGAAAQFTADWELGIKVTPTPEEGRCFVKEYESYRRKKFNHDELRIISAAADYHIAIIARFEHAGKNPMVHPYQDLLKECGEKSFLFA